MVGRTLFSRSATVASFSAFTMLPFSLSFRVISAFRAPSSVRKIMAGVSCLPVIRNSALGGSPLSVVNSVKTPFLKPEQHVLVVAVRAVGIDIRHGCGNLVHFFRVQVPFQSFFSLIPPFGAQLIKIFRHGCSPWVIGL